MSEPQGEVVAVAPRLGHQPALDGLRAVAVLAVVLYHGDVSWAPGGFTGVDAFFVVSGYLITTLLVDEWAGTGSISLRAFWVRRIRRLFPALALLLVAVAGYVLLLAPDVLRRSIRDDGLATLAYVANWRLVWSDQSYFEAAAGVSPLRHTWSLAVEEQWYVAWPLVVVGVLALAARRHARRDRVDGAAAALPLGWLAAGSLVTAVASAAWMAHLAPAGGDTSRAYYGTDTRAQALLVGAALAFALRRWPAVAERVRGAGPVPAALALLGLAGGLGLVAVVDEGTRAMYRGGFLLCAVAWAAVVVGVLGDPHDGPVGGWGNPVRRLLGLGPIVWLGAISYGTYLWNWPAVVVLTPSRTDLDGAALDVLQIGLSVAAAAASYHLVEQPIRRGTWRGRTWWRPTVAVPAAAALTAVALVAAAAGAPPPAPDGAGFAAPAAPGEQVVVTPSDQVPAGAIAAPSGATTPPPAPSDRPLRVTVVGDSVGFSYVWFAPRIEGIELDSEAVVGCGVLPGELAIGTERKLFDEKCPRWASYWQAAADGDPDVVAVFLGAWEVYDTFVGDERLVVGTAPWRRHLAAQLDEGLGILTTGTRSRVAVMTVPCFRDERPIPGGDNARNDPARVAAVNEVLADAVARFPGRATLVDDAALACPDGVFAEEVDGVPFRPDGLHVDRASAVPAWRWLAPVLLELGRRPSL